MVWCGVVKEGCGEGRYVMKGCGDGVVWCGEGGVW